MQEGLGFELKALDLDLKSKDSGFKAKTKNLGLLRPKAQGQCLTSLVTISNLIMF